MKPSEVLPIHRESIRQLVFEAGMTNPRVFGSVVHGDDIDGSDLDILVDPAPKTSLMDLGGLQIRMEQVLGIRVDILTPNGLPLKFRDKVLNEAQPV